jgi:hypothetical protein
MSLRALRSLRPRLECVEERLLATAPPVAGHLGGHLAAAHVHRLLPAPPAARGSSRPVIVMFGGPGTQGALPSNYRDWGAISIWNTTTTRLTFSVSASTFSNNRFFDFTLRPGQHQVYYAAYSPFGNAPLFRVSFDPISRSNPIAVSDINTIFERVNWFPRIGTEGRPYAVTVSVSGYTLTPI